MQNCIIIRSLRMITIVAKGLSFDKYFRYITKSIKHCSRITMVFFLIFITYSYIG